MKTKLHNHQPPKMEMTMPVQLMHWLDALIFDAEQDSRMACEVAMARGEAPNERDVLMNVAAQIARRMVARARRSGRGDDAAIAEMILSDSPQLRAIGEDAAWRWRRAFAR